MAAIALVSPVQAQFLALPTAADGNLPGVVLPLVVTERSHVVVMEYEAWFGPNAVTFQSSAALPWLQSEDMQTIGGGYDSADPAIIERHVEWLQHVGVDAALIEVTNNVSCIFNSKQFADRYLPKCTDVFRSENQNILDNTGNLYPAWSKLGTRLKLIPMLGGIDQDVLYADTDGKTAFEKELEYFGARIQEHLKPTFLILHQFNEFNSSDAGWDANTNDDIEPADQWGYGALDAVEDAICRYRRETRAKEWPEADLSFRNECAGKD